jgi:hypothetical protein
MNDLTPVPVSPGGETEAPSLDRLLEMLVVVHRAIAARREQLNELEKKKAKLSDAILARMAATDAVPSYSLVADGRRWKIGRRTREVITVTDWNRLYAHILETKDFTLLNRSVTQSTAAALLTANPDIRWLDRLTIPALSITSTPIIPTKD